MGSIFYGQKYPHLARKILQNRSKTLQNLAFFTFPNIAKSVKTSSQFTVLYRFSSDRFKKKFDTWRKPPSLGRRTTACGTKKSFQDKKIFIPTQNSPLFLAEKQKSFGQREEYFLAKKRREYRQGFPRFPFQRVVSGQPHQNRVIFAVWMHKIIFLR